MHDSGHTPVLKQPGMARTWVPSFEAGPLKLVHLQNCSQSHRPVVTRGRRPAHEHSRQTNAFSASAEQEQTVFMLIHKLTGPLKSHHCHSWTPLPRRGDSIHWSTSSTESSAQPFPSMLLGFASRSEEVNFCSLRAALTYVLTIYRCSAHLICSTIHKNMQLP